MPSFYALSVHSGTQDYAVCTGSSFHAKARSRTEALLRESLKLVKILDVGYVISLVSTLTSLVASSYRYRYLVCLHNQLGTGAL
jgi:hypothetical protein